MPGIFSSWTFPYHAFDDQPDTLPFFPGMALAITGSVCQPRAHILFDKCRCTIPW